MAEIDKPGSFYPRSAARLSTTAKRRSEPLLYDSKDLTTHAVCVGMTGSGKTGLCLALLGRSRARRHSGDRDRSQGRPWATCCSRFRISSRAISGRGSTRAKRPASRCRPTNSRPARPSCGATVWPSWDEGPDRIRRFCDAVDRVIYTPGSSAGIPITVLKSFAAPPAELVADADAFSERIASATSGLLALMGIDADPVRSREHIFLSTLLDTAWRAGKDVDLRQLIQDIKRPPITKVGAVDLESFYPAKERNKLAMSLNNLLASPSFASWLEGEPLDIQRILYTPEKQAAAGDLFDRASRRCPADVLRHDPAQRNPGLDSHAAGHEQPAGNSLHGRSVRLFSADGQSAGEAADAHAAQAGPRVSVSAACWRRRIRSTSTTRDCRTRALGSWAACKPSATRPA